MQIGARNDEEVAAELEVRIHLVSEHQPAGVARYQRNPLSGMNHDVAVGVCSAVGTSADDKTGLKGRIDKAIGQMPLQAADFSAHGKVQALPARIADVVK